MKKKAKSITLHISIFFILLNLVSFISFFYLVNLQYQKSNVSNIKQMNQTAAQRIQDSFADIKFYMNDLTLKMYVDSPINHCCNRIMKGDYQSEASYNLLISSVESGFYNYLQSYRFIQAVGIFLADENNTDIYSGKLSIPNMFEPRDAFRREAYQQALDNNGVIACFNVGSSSNFVFARKLKDYSTVLHENRTNGVVAVFLEKQYILSILRNAVTTQHGYAYLTSPNGMVTGSTREGDVGKSAHELASGGGDLVLTTPIDSINQNLVVVTPYQDITLSASAFTGTLVLFALIMAALNFTLVFLISKRLTKPMGHFVRQLQEIGITDMTRRVTAGGYSEIEDIAENFNAMMDRVNHLVQENYVIGLNEKNARIAALQSQINPHFIFNTLDTINWKVMFLDMPEVTNMISCLGDMLRYTTYQYGNYVTVEQELSQIENYLYIQDIRFDHSFQKYLLIDPQARSQVIPCLILQPLVENALNHGLKGLERPGVIVIRIEKCGSSLKFLVFDNGFGMEQEKIDEILRQDPGLYRESIGVRNVHDRLRLTYGQQYGVAIHSRPGSYTRVTMEIPTGEEKEHD